jgi:hypothetical protein
MTHAVDGATTARIRRGNLPIVGAGRGDLLVDPRRRTPATAILAAIYGGILPWAPGHPRWRAKTSGPR